MADTPEAKVKKQVVAQLKQLGAYYFYPVTGGYGRSGVPDIVGCYRGQFFAIECKANGNKPTPLQSKNIASINDCGGIAWVVDETNVDGVTDHLKTATAQPTAGFEEFQQWWVSQTSAPLWGTLSRLAFAAWKAAKGQA